MAGWRFWLGLAGNRSRNGEDFWRTDPVPHIQLIPYHSLLTLILTLYRFCRGTTAEALSYRESLKLEAEASEPPITAAWSIAERRYVSAGEDTVDLSASKFAERA